MWCVTLRVEKENGFGATIDVGRCCRQGWAALSSCLVRGLWSFSSDYTLIRWGEFPFPLALML